jgi:hypothetical protein
MRKEIEALSLALPFNTYADGALKVGEIIGYEISTGRLGELLSTVRAFPQYYGFTVPFVERGRYCGGGPRFVRVLTNRGEDPPFTEEERTQIRNGLFSHLEYTQATCLHEATALELAASYYPPESTFRRHLRILTRQLKYLSETANDISSMVPENGYKTEVA